jgi:hypothetical protein
MIVLANTYAPNVALPRPDQALRAALHGEVQSTAGGAGLG